MKKVILFIPFLLWAYLSIAQKKYICEYTDTISMALPDSVFAGMLTNARPDVEIPDDVMKDFLSQVKAKPLHMTQTRIVWAGVDRTIISIDRKTRDGVLKTETFDSLLYQNDELYPDSASANGFSTLPINRSRKQFVATGKKVTILNYKCDEYLSTDSTCHIWVTAELPDYINPGIRKGAIKGAVLGYELKSEALTTKTIFVRFGRSL